MFTPSMTREEIVAEAKQDFNQLKAFMQVELNAFGRRYNRKYNNSCIMGSIVHTRTFKTRRHNTWTFFLYIRDYAATCMHAVGCIYIQLNKYDGTSEYLILDLATECLPNLITTHFLQRYKERYLEPNHVKLGGISPALYFFCLGGERKMSNYTPKNWTEEDMEQRFVLISPQGLIVVADEGDLRTFITFLDQDNLSRYKAQIYEEEQMIAKLSDCEKASGWYDQTLKFIQIFNTPNAREILRRFFTRAKQWRPESKQEDMDLFFKNFDELERVVRWQWDYIEKCSSDKEREELRKTYKPDITNKIKGIDFLKNMI